MPMMGMEMSGSVAQNETRRSGEPEDARTANHGGAAALLRAFKLPPIHTHSRPNRLLPGAGERVEHGAVADLVGRQTLLCGGFIIIMI